MKRLLITTLSLILLLSGCSQEEAKPDTNPNEVLANTKWQADDKVADALYSGENLQYFEFISLDTVQYYKTNNGDVYKLKKGTYQYEEPDVKVSFADGEQTLTLSGSLLISQSYKEPGGGWVTYRKQ